MTSTAGRDPGLLARRPLVSFFCLAFAGSWLCWLPLVLTRGGLGLIDVELPFRLGALLNTVALFAGPFAAALVMTKAVGDSAWALLKSLLDVRARPLSWLLALVAIPAVLVGVALLRPAGQPTPVPGLPADLPPVGLLVVAATLVLGGPLQEELGWRGFALPRLQRHHHPVVAAVLLGVVWGLWHLPQFTLAAWDTPHQNLGDVAAFLVLAVGAALVLSWVRNTAGRSLLTSVLGHNAVNAVGVLAPFALHRTSLPAWSPALALLALGLLGVAVTRGRLGATR